MRTKLTLLAAGAVLIVGAALPYVVGTRVEAQFRDRLAAVSGGGVHGEVLEYRRGWLGADALTEWVVRRGKETVSFRLAHRVHHGPTLAADLAAIESTLVPPEEVRAELAPYLGEQPPVAIDSRIGVDGTQVHRLRVPSYAGAIEGAEVDWGGVSGEVTVDPGLTRMDGLLTAPRLRVKEGAAQREVELAGAQVSFHYHRASADATWLGESAFTLDQVTASDPAGVTTVVKPGIRASMDEDSGLLATRVELGAARAAGAGQSVEQPALVIALRRIDAVTFRTLERRLAEAAEQGYTDAAAQPLVSELTTQLVPSLLARSPELELVRFGAETKDGAFEVKARLRYVGKGDLANFVPQTDVEADAGLRVPLALLETLARLAGEAGAAGPEAILQGLMQQVEMLEQSGWLTRKEGVLASRLELKGGKLTINGQAADGLLAALPLAGSAADGGGDAGVAEGTAADAEGNAAADSPSADANVSQDEAALASRLFEQIMATPDDDLATIERLYLQVIEQCPGTGAAQESYWRLSNLYLRAYDAPKYAEARALLERFVSRYPDSEGVEMVRPRLAYIYEELQDWPAAATAYGELVDRPDVAPEVIAEYGFSYAQALKNAGHPDEALIWYRRFLDALSDPNDFRASIAQEDIAALTGGDGGAGSAEPGVPPADLPAAATQTDAVEPGMDATPGVPTEDAGLPSEAMPAAVAELAAPANSPDAVPPATEALRRSAADLQGKGDYLGALRAYREFQAITPDPRVADRIKRLEAYLRIKGIEVPDGP